MWTLKKKKNRLVVASGEEKVGKMGEESQKVQTSSHKLIGI